MTCRTTALGLLLCFVAAGCTPFVALAPPNVQVLSNLPPARRAELTVGPPQTSQNLTVFILHGPGTMPTSKLLTLAEAISQKKARVCEEGSVNELTIENFSDRPIYVQSGDIVKGGQQDRTIADDFIVAAGAGRVPVDAFCVEHSRWTGRGNESSSAFDGSFNMLASKELKLAARQQADQSAVWNDVDQLQSDLSHTLHEPVNADDSPSSLQLALENSRLQQWAGEYMQSLSSAAYNDDDSIGFAFAINGRLNSAEAYASHALFCKLWPKLLKAAAIEAIARMQEPPGPPASRDDVYRAITEADAGAASGKTVNGLTRLITYEAPDAVLFEMSDAQMGRNWLHRSYIVK